MVASSDVAHSPRSHHVILLLYAINVVSKFSSVLTVALAYVQFAFFFFFFSFLYSVEKLVAYAERALWLQSAFKSIAALQVYFSTNCATRLHLEPLWIVCINTDCQRLRLQGRKECICASFLLLLVIMTLCFSVMVNFTQNFKIRTTQNVKSHYQMWSVTECLMFWSISIILGRFRSWTSLKGDLIDR